MKIGCYCGATIVDGTDDLPHKGHVIPDQAWLATLDALDEQVVDPLAAGSIGTERAYHASRSILVGAARLMYQCSACGRLYIDDRRGKLQCFVPATPETERQVLRGRDGKG
jgi:hypothetical protein